MHVSLYARISLKERPDGFLGLTGEDLVIGKDSPVDLDQMLVGLFQRLADYYGLVATPDELNKQLETLSQYFANTLFTSGPSKG